jgi:L-ascorbate metabolism protein UlaG (beta-lactamase superfamily)
MQIRRTACAGVLLTLDGTRLLLDGVGEQILTYPATPESIRQELRNDPPEGVLITHRHKDHYDASFVSSYVDLAAGPVIGPAQIPNAVCTDQTIGSLQITCVESRHIGKTDSTQHVSFVIRGSRCVWLTGDASPSLFRNTDLPKPDVLIAPYAYAMGSGWEITKALAPKTLVLLHLPERENDLAGLWNAVEDTIADEKKMQIVILQMGQTIEL